MNIREGLSSDFDEILQLCREGKNKGHVLLFSCGNSSVRGETTLRSLCVRTYFVIQLV